MKAAQFANKRHSLSLSKFKTPVSPSEKSSLYLTQNAAVKQSPLKYINYNNEHYKYILLRIIFY